VQEHYKFHGGPRNTTSVDHGREDLNLLHQVKACKLRYFEHIICNDRSTNESIICHV